MMTNSWPTCSQPWGTRGTKDLFRRLLQQALQQLIDAELTAAIGAGAHERTDTMTSATAVGCAGAVIPAGDVELRISKVRVGAFLPSLGGLSRFT